MKKIQPPSEHAPQSPGHPSLKSADTVAILVANYQEKRALIDEAGQRAASARQEAENHLHTAQERRARADQLELEIKQLREEGDRYEQLGRDCYHAADQRGAEQSKAALVLDDITQLLGRYAPAALAAAQAPPQPSDGSGAHQVLVAGVGTGPQALPNSNRLQEH